MQLTCQKPPPTKNRLIKFYFDGVTLLEIKQINSFFVSTCISTYILKNESNFSF